MTSRLLALLILFLSALAYLTANVLPAILSLSFCLYALYASLEFNPKIEAERRVERVLYEGRKTIAKLRVRNLTKKDYVIRLIEELPVGFSSENLESYLRGFEEKELGYSIVPARGVYRLRGKLLVEEPRGLFKKEFRLNEVEVEVLPSIERLKEEAKYRANLEIAAKTLFGLPSEFKSLREFYEGDEARFIDWKASARLGELVVKEFIREWEGDIYLVLDTSGEMRKKIEHVLSLVYQLLNSLSGKKVGIVICDEFGVKKVVRASEDFSAILRELKISPVFARQSIKVPEFRISLRRFFRRPKSFSLKILREIPRKSFLIFLTDLSNPDEILATIVELRKYCKVLVISPNPVLFQRVENEEALLRLYKAYVEREKFLRKVNAIVPVIDVGPNDSLMEVLR